MSYKSENWKEKLEQVRNHIALKEGSVEKSADDILNDQIEEELEKSFIEEVVEENLDEEMPRHLQQISKMFKTKNKTEIEGIDKLVVLSSMSTVMDMQKQNPKGFMKYAKALGKVKEEVETEETQLDEKSKDVRKRYRGKEQKSVNSLIMQNGVDKVQKLFDDEPKEFDALIGRLAKLESVEHDEIVLGEAGMGDKIGKLFKTKDKKEIDGIANLMNMTSVKVLQSMMKQNPKGFKRMAKKMGELPAMEEVQESVEKTTEKLVERNMLGRLAKQLKLNEEGKQKMFTYFEKGELNQ